MTMLARRIEAKAKSLTPEELRRAHEIAQKLKGGETLRQFIKRLSPNRPPPRHYNPIIRKLEEARSRPVKFCLSVPPRYGKTTLLQHAIPWWLTHFPEDTCGYASYSDHQAWSKSRVTREIAQHAGVELLADAANLAEWRTTAGGGLLSGGLGAGFTGQGISGLMVVDDPFKKMEEAQSKLIRDKIGETFEAVISTRDEGMSTIVTHTRWHEDDLIGRLAKDRDFTVINLPALAEMNDPLGREVGEPLWPERGLPGFQRAALERRRERNPFVFAALYQGRPRPRGATVFGAPHYYDPKTLNLTGCRYVLAADPAASTKTSADYSAAVVLAIMGSGEKQIAYVLYVYRAQVPMPQFANDLLGLQQKYGRTAINVEAVGAFKAIPQMLKAIRPNLRIKEIEGKELMGDKLLRSQPVAGAWNAAEPRVLVPNDSPPWLEPFLDEVAAFTGVNDPHDDQIDALSHAWNQAGGRSMFDVDWTKQL